MDDDFDEDDDEFIVPLPPRPLSWLDLPACAAWATARAFGTAEHIADEIADRIAGHIGYHLGRAQMAEQDAREIESMIGGGEDG